MADKVYQAGTLEAAFSSLDTSLEPLIRKAARTVSSYGEGHVSEAVAESQLKQLVAIDKLSYGGKNSNTAVAALSEDGTITFDNGPGGSIRIPMHHDAEIAVINGALAKAPAHGSTGKVDETIVLKIEDTAWAAVDSQNPDFKKSAQTQLQSLVEQDIKSNHGINTEVAVAAYRLHSSDLPDFLPAPVKEFLNNPILNPEHLEQASVKLENMRDAAQAEVTVLKTPTMPSQRGQRVPI